MFGIACGERGWRERMGWILVLAGLRDIVCSRQVSILTKVCRQVSILTNV